MIMDVIITLEQEYIFLTKRQLGAIGHRCVVGIEFRRFQIRMNQRKIVLAIVGRNDVIEVSLENNDLSSSNAFYTILIHSN